MRKLTPDEVRALDNGASVHVKLTRLYWPKAVVAYEGPSTLYVQRHPKTNVAVVITPKLFDWAEYDPRRDFEHDGSLVAEDYQMEIFE